MEITADTVVITIIIIISTYPALLTTFFLLKERRKSDPLQFLEDEQKLREFERLLAAETKETVKKLRKAHQHLIKNAEKKITQELTRNVNLAEKHTQEYITETKKLEKQLAKSTQEYEKNFSALVKESLATANRSVERFLQELGAHIEEELKIAESLKYGSETAEKITEEYEKFISDLEVQIVRSIQKNDQQLRESFDKLRQETKIPLTEALTTLQAEIEKELQKTKKELAEHKEKRMSQIDQNISEIVEKTIYKTLGKSLSLDEHLDLIEESLKEAKQEKFF